MEYVMAEINFSGNDDVNFQGFKLACVESLEDWQNQIKAKVEERFEENGYVEIYHSDNDSTPFDSAEELINTVTLKKITKAEFEAVSSVVGQSYGNTEDFMDYDAPVPKKTRKPK
jgi:hypothetical protein